MEHYTKASKQLSITQPSLSHAIAALEDELGVRLFEKDGRNVILTKYGRYFLKDVEEILTRLDSSVASLKMTGSGNGTIDIGCIRTLGSSYVPALMRHFKELNPDKSICFRLRSVGGLSAEIISGLKNRAFDVAFCSKYKDDPSIDFIRIASQELVLAVPLDHPLAARDSITLKETLPWPQILFDRRSGLRDIIDSLFGQINASPECVMEVEEDQVIAGLVSQGFGIAVLPEIHVPDTLPLKYLRITDPEPRRDFYMASLKDVYQAPIVRAFMKTARDYCFESSLIF